MRNINYDPRNFSEPIILIKYKQEKENGILNILEEKRWKIFASIMHNNNLISSQGERNTSFEISIVIPAPNFQITNLDYKIIVNNQQFLISKINFNFVWRGSIQIIASYEKEFIEIAQPLESTLGVK